MDDEDNLKTPDAYVRNHGVEVTLVTDMPQYGQIEMRVKHNSYQSTRLQMGLEQAEELYEKLGAAILTATYDVNKMWRYVVESYENVSVNRKDWSDSNIVGFVKENHVKGVDAFLKRAGAGK